MSIKFSRAYQVGDQLFTTLVAAQIHELAELLRNPIPRRSPQTGTLELKGEEPMLVASLLVLNQDAVLAILKQKERTRTREAKPKRGRRPAQETPTASTGKPSGNVSEPGRAKVAAVDPMP